MGNSFSFSLLFTLKAKITQFDVIHAHSHLFYSTIICAFFRYFYSTPLIITNHGLFSQTAPMWLQKMYILTIGKWILNSADRVICYTGIEKEQLVKYGVDKRKIVVIHNGISSTDFSPLIIESRKQLLWIGRFTPGKGVEILLDAFKIFHSWYPDYSLLLIGNGPLKKNILDEIKQMDLSDSIYQVDYIPNRDLPSIYRNSAVFILPSLEEGVPRTILEAMSCSIPVVCTNLPQLKDIVAGCGIMVPPREPGALADAIYQIISNPDLARRLGDLGREKIVSQYSWDDTVEKTIILYEDVVNSTQKASSSVHISAQPLKEKVSR